MACRSEFEAWETDWRQEDLKMLYSTFDPWQHYTYLKYGRMSDPGQNPRSPDQQYDNMLATLARVGYPWVGLGDYRDDGKSGRFIRKRKGFVQMINNIRRGIVAPDLILVDEIFRWGRCNEARVLRRELREKFGILVLTADDDFADPTTPAGKARTHFDEQHAEEDGVKKSGWVLRGKRDAVKLGHWPGGKPPFGGKLESVVTPRVGKQDIVHSILVWDSDTNWIVKLMFEKARAEGWGDMRLARFLNEHPDVPDDLKPFSPSLVGYILSSPVYAGTYVWGRHCTGIVDDTRVLQKNPANRVTTVHDFCEPLVSEKLWEDVQRLRRARSKALKASRSQNDDGKLIKPLVPGLTLKYPLTGLVYCGECGRRMRPMSSKGDSTSGKRYAYYHCYAVSAGACTNKRYVREPWLRETVMRCLQERLFPPAGSSGGVPEWFGDVAQRILGELGRLRQGDLDRAPAMELELEKLNEQISGWAISLADRKLPATVREDIVGLWDSAKARVLEIENTLNGWDAREKAVSNMLDPARAMNRLHALEELLARGNPTALGLELSFHIRRIECHRDGRVTVQTSRIGLFRGLADMICQSECGTDNDAGVTDPNGVKRARVRQRTKLRVIPTDNSSVARATAGDIDLAPADLNGLPDRLFWQDEFRVPKRTCWAAENAAQVEQVSNETELTLEKIADRFGVSRPTIRHALKIAKEAQRGAEGTPVPPASEDAQAG
jgi:DNA invertase Pin-like site-specific DNA recombinase